MQSVLENMIVGAPLSVIVLILFLKTSGRHFVIACSIPLSVIFAVVLMYFSNISLNIISLSGLALGIGMLVDNSIVVIENIYRLRSEGYSIKKAAVEGAGGVTGAIIASTLTTVCVFVPIVFTEGNHEAAVCGYRTHNYVYIDSQPHRGVDVCADDGGGTTKIPKRCGTPSLKNAAAGICESFWNWHSSSKTGRVHRCDCPACDKCACRVFQRFSFMDMNMETDQLTVTVAEGSTKN